MSGIGFLVSWANAPFAVAMGVVVVFSLLQASGVLGLIAGEAHDADHDVDHDLQDLDHEADHDAEHDDSDTAPVGGSLAAALGVGKLPFSLIWQTFALAAAGCGYALNLRYLHEPGGPPLYTLAWTLPSAALSGTAVVATAARLLGPIFSSKEHEATRRNELVGQIGIVISSKVDEHFGEVRIRDKTGHDIRVVCRLARAVATSPRERESVVVVECDDKGAVFVEPLGDVESGRDLAG